MGSQSLSADAQPGTCTATSLTRRLPNIHLNTVLAVFCGGAIGIMIRYAFVQILVTGSFHASTLTVNILACLCYAGLIAYLAGSSRLNTRTKELTNRGLGMDVCDGLSTMPTSALEGFAAIHDGRVATSIACLLAAFALGLVYASTGVWAGTHLTGPSNVSAEAPADTNAATASKGGKA